MSKESVAVRMGLPNEDLTSSHRAEKKRSAGDDVDAQSDGSSEDSVTIVNEQDPSTLATKKKSAHVAQTFATMDALRASQEAQRMQLAARHRASHEMLRRRLLASTERAIASWRYALSSSSTGEPKPTSDDITGWINNNVADHRNMLLDMLDRQEMEASTLAATQGGSFAGVPVLRVSFPFPEIFSQVKEQVIETFFQR